LVHGARPSTISHSKCETASAKMHSLLLKFMPLVSAGTQLKLPGIGNVPWQRILGASKLSQSLAEDSLLARVPQVVVGPI